ncbi:hypothetical protein GCM10007973_08630 [Polymorphobacter multimanifer]|uniref:Carboxypeptidase regulatory-like domain-containing protein n=1 Tax=Polymorphobacter multimanifer TaxID=1070431 RepID=A0A841L5A2_9SPHN|nr:carboxypeptidase-like regulatory domain-containing protein [Polymorphobacter multimanifer]MBB6228069.1 hypothetical protein [Polymorphobacter multimanifer]GGI74052.1 hypothetical protein GCM10007973_08630 [Polymorphobacter multimanifer]
MALTLSYLVTVRLDDPVAEHRVAAAIAFAVMSAQGFELSDRSAAETCVAIGLPPAAGCVIIASIEQERVMPRAPLVREPARIKISPADWLDGIVLGPGDVPVAGAYVRLADAATVTGPDGRFRFRVPAETTVEVTARARDVGASVQAKPGIPARISLPLEA